jgi:tetratricopeptide (TPR) repeat protein
MQRQFAVNYSAIGDVADALDFAEASVKGARAILAVKPDAESMRLLANSLIALGRVQSTRGAMDAARAAFNEAISTGDKIGVAYPGNSSPAAIKAEALIYISDLATMSGQTTDALQAAKEGVGVARTLSNSDPSNREWRVMLADGLERAGNLSGGITTAMSYGARLDPSLPVDRKVVDYADAVASYQESSGIYRALVAADPTNTDFRARLENILIRLGDLRLVTGALADALSAHKEALSISSDLLAADSGNVQWKRRVEVNELKLQTVYSAQGNLDAALDAAQESLVISKQLNELDPENLLWRRDLCSHYRSLGEAERGKGDESAARESFGKALTTCRETATHHPKDAVVRIQLAFTLYQASKNQPSDYAAPLLREALSILGALDREGVLPETNANWAPFISSKLANLEGTTPPR